MNTEYEARTFINDIESVINQLRDKSCVFKYASFQKRYVYDLKPAEKGKWLRLRSDGYMTSLTYKEISSQKISGTKEIEIVVSNFETTNELLSKIGFTPRSYQENFRIHFISNEATFDIDFWPLIQPYLEIESYNSIKVKELFRELGFDNSDLLTANVDKIFYDYYNIDLDSISKLVFNESEKEYLYSLERRLNDGK